MYDNGETQFYEKGDLYEITNFLNRMANMLRKTLPAPDAKKIDEGVIKYAIWLDAIASGMGEDDCIVVDGFSTTIEHNPDRSNQADW